MVEVAFAYLHVNVEVTRQLHVPQIRCYVPLPLPLRARSRERVFQFGAKSTTISASTTPASPIPHTISVKMEEMWDRSHTVDPEVRAYVLSLCNAVGGSSSYDDTYAVGDDALAALNDILRWLKLVR